MAPPTRLRPHLNDLLQKNLELEHVAADLRHQLTQSSAKWADERKTLAVRCDALMASFAKFRARLDVQPSDFGDSEGEVEQNLDAGGHGEETGEVDKASGMVGVEPEKDRGSLATQDLHERCRALTVELRVKEEELEESRRKREAAEEQLQRIQRSLDTQSEQLRAVLASSQADASNNVPLELTTPDDASAQASPSKTAPEDTQEKLDQANQEITRLRQLLHEWKKYGSDWKRDGQLARVRASELNAKINAAEETKARQDAEIQRLTSALADQTVAVEQQRTACQASEERVHELEAMVSRLRAQLSPERQISFDSEQFQAVRELPGSTQLQHETNQTTENLSDALSRADDVLPMAPEQALADTSTNKRGEMIMLKIPYRGFIRKLSAENNESSTEQQDVTGALSQQAPANQSIRASPAPERRNEPPNFNATDFEICVHTCNTFLCRNDSQSFLWLRKQHSLPRHVLSTKKHQLCAPPCPGYRFLNMPLADAMKEPRRAKCRPPTETELALAIEEASKMPLNGRVGEKRTRAEESVGSEGLGEPEEHDELEGGSTREEETRGREGGRSPRMGTLSVVLGKRLRTRTGDGDERVRKLRPR